MMAGYIDVSLQSDPDVLVQNALVELASRIPGFVAREAHLEVILLEVASRINAETLYLAGTVPDDIFRYFGESLLGIPPVEALSSEALSTWTMINNAGYTIPQGTLVAFKLTGDRIEPFVTAEEVVVPPGNTVATGVRILSVEQGTGANGVGPTGLILVDSLSFVLSVSATTAASGGVDRETDAAYMGRLSDELKILSPRFVLAKDAAVLARRIQGVYRAIGIDNYNPADNTYTNQRMITVAMVDAQGVSVSTTVKNAVQAYLQSLREINFIINVTNPTFTTINVVFTVVVNPNYDLADVDTRSEAAVRAYLNPATWAGGDQVPPIWDPTRNVVRYLEVAQVINEVVGVDYISVLTINGGTANVTLTGAAPLPTVGTVTGTAVYV